MEDWKPVGWVDELGRLWCVACADANGLVAGARVNRGSEPHAFERCDGCGRQLEERPQGRAKVLVLARYANYLPPVWITHRVCETVRDAYTEAGELVEQGRFPAGCVTVERC